MPKYYKLTKIARNNASLWAVDKNSSISQVEAVHRLLSLCCAPGALRVFSLFVLTRPPPFYRWIQQVMPPGCGITGILTRTRLVAKGIVVGIFTAGIKQKGRYWDAKSNLTQTHFFFHFTQNYPSINFKLPAYHFFLSPFLWPKSSTSFSSSRG